MGSLRRLGTAGVARGRRPDDGAGHRPGGTARRGRHRRIGQGHRRRREGGPDRRLLALALGSGISVAEVRNYLAQSQSQSLDLGLIGSTLTAEQCDGAAARSDRATCPRRCASTTGPVTRRTRRASSRPASSSTGSSRRCGPPRRRFAEAVSTAGPDRAGPLLDLTAGTATATTEVIDGGAARIAHAHVGVDLELPGILKLANLQWDAYHRTGTEAEAHASFTFGDIEVLGRAAPHPRTCRWTRSSRRSTPC